MKVTVRQVKRDEVSQEDSWWFAMFDELWVVTSGSAIRELCASKEDAYLFIIDTMTTVVLTLQENHCEKRHPKS